MAALNSTTPSTANDNNDITSDPIGSLAVKNGKAVQGCVELFLAGKSINHLHGFSRFVNLDTLFLNDNRLTHLNNLDSLSRLKRLYAHNNQITTLKGSLLAFTFIDTLTLFNNKLQDLHACLSILSQLRHLEELDMHNNPLSEETNYRMHVIKQLPWLKVLDRHIVTDDERLAASQIKTLYESLEEEDKPKRTGMKRKASASAIQAERLVSEAVGNIAVIVKTKRILLKDHFMEEDPRNEWVILEDVFSKYLQLYQLDSIVENVGREENMNTYDLLLKKYKGLVPMRSMTLGRDATITMGNTRFIDYVKFCRDIEPSHNSRDLDNMQRLRESAREMRLGPTVDDKIPLSDTVKKLQSSVKLYESELQKKAQEERRAMIKLSEDQLRSQRNAKVPMAKSEKDFVTPESALDPWEIKELRFLVIASSSYDKKANTVKLADLRKTLDEMILCGRMFTTEKLEEFIELEQKEKDALAEFADVDPEDSGVNVVEEKEPISRFFLSLESETADKDKNVPVEIFMAGIQFGLEDGTIPPPAWRGVTTAEAIHKRDALFKEAEKLNKRVMLLGDSDPKMMMENIKLIKEMTHRANKLDKIASGELEHKYNRLKGAKIFVRGDSYLVKTLHEVKGKDDEDISDDEEEPVSKDLLQEEKDRVMAERKKMKEQTILLKKKFGLKEDKQEQFRKSLHTRRNKSFLQNSLMLGKSTSSY